MKLSSTIADFRGIQSGEGITPDLLLYDLKSEIPGHPAGSTVTERTLRGAGFKCDMLAFLDRLNESGETNMFGAAAGYLAIQFVLDHAVAKGVLVYWMRSFREGQS
jgi:hypothetical protein